MGEDQLISQFANDSALAVIAGVAVWGAISALRSLWAALQKREESLERAHHEYSTRLEQLNASVADLVRGASEEASRTRLLLQELAEDTHTLCEEFERVFVAQSGGAGAAARATEWSDDDDAPASS
jgi:chromosome segregation ATPase